MLRFFRAKFWRQNLPLLRTSAGRFQLAEKFEKLLWPRIARPATAYRRVFARRTRVVAVVGSLGKSTTTRAVAAALGLPLREISEDNAFAAVALATLRIRPWRRHAAVEVGIGAPGQMVVYGPMLRPDVVVVTSIASDHNISLPTLEATRFEKSQILRGLASSGIAVLNGDDPHVMWMRGTTRARIVTFGFGDSSDVRASDATLDWPRGMTFQLNARGATAIVRTRMIGRTTIYPILAAIAVGLEEGMTLDAMLPRIADLPPTDQRLQPMVTPAGAVILRDDYKSGLETVEAALDVLEQIPARRKVVILGDVEQCPGRRREVYRRLGDRIGHIATRAIFLGVECQAYAAGAFRAGLPRTAMTKAGDDVQAALAALPKDLGAGDVVLVKGRSRQRLARLALALAGRDVRCHIAACPLSATLMCDRCDFLEREWKPDDARALLR